MTRIALLLALLIPWAVHATPTIDGNMTAYDGSAASSHNLNAVTVTAGSYGLLGLRTNSDGDVVDTVSGGCSTSWSQLVWQINGGGGTGTSMHVYECSSMTGGSTTVTVGMTASEILRAVFVTYTGHDGREADVEDNNATGSTVTSGTVTTTVADTKLIGFASASASTTFAPATGENELREAAGRIQVQDETGASATDYTQSWTLGASLANSSVLLALKPSAAASATLLRRRRN